jgi:hypothetical protein
MNHHIILFAFMLTIPQLTQCGKNIATLTSFTLDQLNKQTGGSFKEPIAEANKENRPFQLIADTKHDCRNGFKTHFHDKTNFARKNNINDKVRCYLYDSVDKVFNLQGDRGKQADGDRKQYLALKDKYSNLKNQLSAQQKKLVKSWSTIITLQSKIAATQLKIAATLLASDGKHRDFKLAKQLLIEVATQTHNIDAQKFALTYINEVLPRQPEAKRKTSNTVAYPANILFT